MKRIFLPFIAVLFCINAVHGFSIGRLPIVQQVEDIPPLANPASADPDKFFIGLDETKAPKFIETHFGKNFIRCIYFPDDQIISCTDKNGSAHKFNVQVRSGAVPPFGQGVKIFGYYHNVDSVTGKQAAQKNWVYSGTHNK